MSRVLVYGGNGWIGGQVCSHLKSIKCDFKIARARADDRTGVLSELENYKPTHVICMIGRTHGDGINTIDYLELPGKLVENVKDNLMAPIQLAILCKDRDIHCTYLGTGCIFSRSEDPTSFAYDEDALPDFFGSSYSIVKGFTDRLMHAMDSTVLNVRIRMPITDEDNPRNFITKITKYDKICSIQNSMTVLPELIPIMIDMTLKGVKGTVNLTNPGTISHNDVLEMYRDIVDSSFSWQNFSIKDQDAVLMSKRSNNMLGTQKLSDMYPEIRDIKTAVKACLHEISQKRAQSALQSNIGTQ